MRIVFYPSQGGKVWNGATLGQEALGGSETAIVYMARELAAQGHEVVVFTRGKPGIYDDVAYVAWEKARNILRTLRCDALICARDALPLLWSRQAGVSVYWAHDMPGSAQPLPAAHSYWFVSAFQRMVYRYHQLIPADQGIVVPNGIDPALFRAPAVPQQKTIKFLTRDSDVTLAWTSNPERGLWYAGEVLQRVRKKYPKAELHVYGRNGVYGWDAACEHNYHPDDMHGVILHQPLPKHELAYALATHADLWVYPTWWPETYSIAAVEAQAAGVPVVTTKLGALAQTAAAGVLVEGTPETSDYIDHFTDEVMDLLSNPVRREVLRAQGLEFAETQTWSAAARTAVTSLYQLLGMQAAA